MVREAVKRLQQVGLVSVVQGGRTKGAELLALDQLFWQRTQWSHFLIHTPYVPRTRWYRTVWRNHRLHHFKHEGYWMGVSSNLGDRLLRTNPDQRSIPKSPTARTLGAQNDRPARATS